MKKKLLMLLFFAGVSSVSFAQFSGKGGSEKSGSFFSRMFHGGQRPHGQMGHFDKKKKDANLQDNGTAYRGNRKSGYNVDGDGFGTPKQQKQSRRAKRKKKGLK
jgi:hypothetical protein